MVAVTIRGSISPCGFLARGDEITVQLTDQVQKLIDEGYVDVVETATDTYPDVAAPPDKVAEAQAATTDGDADVTDEIAAPVEPDLPPSTTANTATWIAFLNTHPDGNFITEGRTRDQLVGMWESYVDEHPVN